MEESEQDAAEKERYRQLDELRKKQQGSPFRRPISAGPASYATPQGADTKDKDSVFLVVCIAQNSDNTEAVHACIDSYFPDRHLKLSSGIELICGAYLAKTIHDDILKDVGFTPRFFSVAPLSPPHHAWSIASEDVSRWLDRQRGASSQESS